MAVIASEAWESSPLHKQALRMALLKDSGPPWAEAVSLDCKQESFMHHHTWAVVLAAGDGKRLAGLTTDHQGRHVPKQFLFDSRRALAVSGLRWRGHAPLFPRIASALSWPKRMSTGGSRCPGRCRQGI